MDREEVGAWRSALKGGPIDERHRVHPTGPASPDLFASLLRGLVVRGYLHFVSIRIRSVEEAGALSALSSGGSGSDASENKADGVFTGDTAKFGKLLPGVFNRQSIAPRDYADRYSDRAPIILPLE